MAYPRLTLALNTGRDARQASMASIRDCRSAADRGVCRIGVTDTSWTCADTRRSTSAKNASPFFSEIMATCAPTMASSKIINGDGTVLSHGGGRSNSCTEDTVTPPSGTYWSLEGGCNHDTCGVRKTIYGSQPASCAPVASHVWGAA